MDPDKKLSPTLPGSSRICDGESSAFLAGNTRQLRYACVVTHRHRRKVASVNGAELAAGDSDRDEQKIPIKEPDREEGVEKAPVPEREPDTEEGKPLAPLRLVRPDSAPVAESGQPKRQRRSA